MAHLIEHLMPALRSLCDMAGSTLVQLALSVAVSVWGGQ